MPRDTTPTLIQDTRQPEPFEMNGVRYLTDAETLRVLREILPPAKATRDYSAVHAVMSLGLTMGRIVEAA